MKYKFKKGVFTLLLAGLLSACASQGNVQVKADQNSVEALQQTRSELQLTFSHLSELWWQRAGELSTGASDLPLISNDAATITEINRVLTSKNTELTQKLAQLNQKVELRKRDELEGTKLKLAIKYGGFKAKNQGKSQALATSHINLVQGETQLWRVVTKKGLVLPEMKVTLSEKNDLFIEGQLISQLQAGDYFPSFITSVTVYGQQIYAVGQLDMMLVPELSP